MAAPQISIKNANRVPLSLARELTLYAAAALSTTAAAVHLWVMPEHFAEWWGYGAFFLAMALVQGLFGAALLRYPARPLYLAGIAGNLGLVSFYVVTRTAGIPFVGPHAGEVHAVGSLDLLSVAAELALVGALVALAGESRRAALYAALGAVGALGVGAVLHVLHTGMHEAHGLSPVLHWLQTSVVAIPLSALTLWAATPISRRISGFFFGGSAGSLPSRITWSLAASAFYALASIPANGLATAHAASGSFAAQAARDAGVMLGVGFLLMLAVAALRGAPFEAPRAIDFWRPRAFAAVAGVAMGLMVVGGPAVFGSNLFSSPAGAQAAPNACSAGTANRTYDVAAINVDIPFNRWGDVDPDGQIYVLQQDKSAVKNWSKPLEANPANPNDNRRLRPRPLVIRANVNECVEIKLTNEMNQQQWGGRLVNPRVSMQVRGIAYDAQTSDGGAVGYNDDTTAGIGETKTYYWRMPAEEGLHLFRSQTMTSGEEEDAGSNAHGLYGAIAVEPAGSTWHDPVSGKRLYTQTNTQSGELYIDADIRLSGPNNDFRESVQLAQDYNEVQPGLTGHGFNYGTEPQRNREKAENLPPDGLGEEVSLSSWGYGDPALVKLASGPGPWKPPRANGKLVTDPAAVEDCGIGTPGFDSTSCYTSNVNHAYRNDPTKIRYAMAGVAETHVFHLHANQWLANPKDTATFDPNNPGNPKSATIDSQAFGPGETFTADLLYGAGSRPGTVGDSIFHCHLYPHFAEGFWSLMRVHDVKEDGTKSLPDGTNVRKLEVLPDRAAQAPPAPTADNPGYPRFIPGEFGWRAPQAPGSIREPDPANPAAKRDATRIVAGKPLDATKLDPADALVEKLRIEKNVQNVLNKGAAPKPGAPFTDPCKPGSREVTYNVSVMQRDVIYNEDGWHDTQGRFLVLDKDVPKMLETEKNADGSVKRGPDGIPIYKNQPEPLFVRVNAGDCVNFNLTNLLPNWFGNDAFVKLIQTNMMGQHIHLVKFDVLASDGSTNGWNYQQAAFTREQMDFNNRVLGGTLKPGEKCDASGCRLPNPATFNPKWDGGVEPGQTIRERWYADYELRTVFSHDHHFAAVDQNRGQFAGLLVEPEGMNFRNPKTGQFYQPGNGNVPGAPNCAAPAGCEGGAAGAAMDIIGPNPGDDFREFGLAFQDFVSLTKKNGDPQRKEDVFVGPAAPENYPDADPGIVGVNYRNAPFLLRQESNGRPTDPAHVFSSTVHGDPQTPVLQAYSEDPVQVRLMQGSQEHQHVFSMNGMRWKEDPNNDKSPYVSTQGVGISEVFNFEVPRISCTTGQSCAGDYLYSSTNVDDLYMGMWGILRARSERVPSLLPLPDNAPNAVDSTPELGESVAPGLPTALAPPESNGPATVCRTGAPVKRFDVVAMETKLNYNKHGDHDPYGLIYALASDEAAIKRYETNPDDPTAKKPEPLVLRANEGDCIEVRLTNKLSRTGPFATQHAANGAGGGDAMTPLEPNTGTRAGLRVSLSPQVVKYDVRGSDGTAVGYNRDQTVAPGATKTYRWHADDVGAGEIGATNLLDFGDVRGHRHHGLFAGLNIEPKNATYHDPKTGEQIKSGVSADVRVPGAPDFREHTLFFQDGLNLRDKAGNIIADSPDPAPHPEDPNAPPEPPEQNGPAGQENDHIDQGEKGFNYGSAPFRHRIGREAVTATAANPLDGRLMANVYSSRAINPQTGRPNGDPDTPVFRSYAGDNVRMRVLQGADKQRQNVFEQLGHAWRQYPDDPGSPLISAQGGFNVGRALNVHLKAGNGFAGDYRFADGMYRHHLSAGMWGLSRVYPRPSAAALNPTPIGPVDNPRAGGHPLLPLEISNTATSLTLAAAPAKVQPGAATTLSGRLATASGPLANRSVVLEQKPAGTNAFTAVPGGDLRTNANGNFSLANVKPAKTTDYRARFAGAPGAGLSAATSAVRQVVVEAAPVVKAKSAVSLKVATTPLKLGKSRVISGALSPAHPGKVTLVIRKPGADVVRSLTLTGSRYSFTYKPPVAGAYTVQVRFAGDADHLASASPLKRFSVTR